MTAIRHKVRRCEDGWLAVVLIGERRLQWGPYVNKRVARKIARAECAKIAPAREY
jgi:hypothetical protein